MGRALLRVFCSGLLAYLRQATNAHPQGQGRCITKALGVCHPLMTGAQEEELGVLASLAALLVSESILAAMHTSELGQAISSQGRLFWDKVQALSKGPRSSRSPPPPHLFFEGLMPMSVPLPLLLPLGPFQTHTMPSSW